MLQELKIDQTTVTYRELSTVDELIAYFRLRYKEYPSAGYHIDSNRDELDIDSFDFYAHFVGAFIIEQCKEKLIGGVRMIEKDNIGPTADRIKAICELSKDLQKIPETSRPAPFQLMDTLDLSWLIKECEVAGKRLVEFNRTVINHQYRRSGIGVKLVSEMHNLAASIGIEEGFGCCPPKLQSFYKDTGCQSLYTFYHPFHAQNLVLLRVFPSSYIVPQIDRNVLVVAG